MMSRKMLNIKGQLLSLERPVVMGVLNVSPDSFYPESRQLDESAISARIETIISEGGTMIDLGGCSTRPSAEVITVEEEWRRLTPALRILQKMSIPASIDTFRSEVAKRAVADFGISMINDVSGGVKDEKMFDTVAKLGVPYILTNFCDSLRVSHFFEETALYFAWKIRTLRLMGVNDVIVDLGFGFGKTLDQNYTLLKNLKNISLLIDCPILIGISRKSMIYSLLGCGPEESLNGTTVLHTFSLLNGASILRVHDVKAAVEVVTLVEKLKC